MPKDQDYDWFEAAWAEREEGIYSTLFGSLGNGIYPLDYELFSGIFGRTEVDPRWLTIGVFESPPSAERNSWLYVTSGLSNAWEATQPDSTAWSGLGVELLCECTTQSSWALSLVRKLTAYQLLLGAGHFGEREPLDFWDRMHPGASIDGKESELQALLFVPSPHFGGEKQLLSGRFEFLQIIGITMSELAVGQEQGYEALHARLLAASVSPVIDPRRGSIV